MTHRIGSHSDDWGGDSDLPCDCDTRKKTTTPNNSIRDITDEEEPFGGLVINHYGIYNKADQKALNAYILGEVMELLKLLCEDDKIKVWNYIEKYKDTKDYTK